MGKTHLLFFVSIVLLIAGCGGEKNESDDTQMLVVERQSVQLSNKIESDSYIYNDDFSIDVPLYGPQPLMDTLKVFLNKKLYEAFDWTVDSADFSEKELFQDDLTKMLSYYKEKYKPYQNSICNHYSFNLFLIAQTESFVTYGLEFCHCGANCGSEFYCYTFSKKDGHLCEIIDSENLSKYVEEHYKNNYDNISESFNIGLLEDGVLSVAQEASNHHYVASRVEMEKILPYLSKDARELINSGDKTKYSFYDWSLGRKIGKAETEDGDTVILMRCLPWWSFSEDENEDLSNVNLPDKELPYATAYTIKNGRFVVSESEMKSLVFIGETKDYLIRIDANPVDNSCRYSSWEQKDVMLDDPDIVIDQPQCSQLGHGTQMDLGYSFENKGYVYEVWTNPYPEGPQLKVYQGKKLLLQQEMQVLFSTAP